MGRDGGGVYSLPSAYDVDTGDTILPEHTETPFEDLETDMNTARPIVAGGTGGTTAKLARAGLVVRDIRAIDTTGSADTYSLTSGDGLTPSDGDSLIVIINATNTGATTLNVDTTGAKAIKKMVAGSATALVANDLYSGHHHLLSYDTGETAWILHAFIASVVADTTPQLGGQLDVNGKAIGDGTLELLTFTEDASAVNHVNIENEATGSGPIISSVGDNTNVDLNIDTKATGTLNLKTGGTARMDLTAGGVRLGGANARVTTVLDQDNMSSNSATSLATQQSIKAYALATADKATVVHYRAATADKWLDGAVWSAAAEVAISYADPIVLDMALFINGVVTLAGNATLGNPSNTKVGQSGYIRLIQDGTGSRTLAYGTSWEFAGGAAPTLSTTAADEDLLFYTVVSSTRIIATLVLDIS